MVVWFKFFFIKFNYDFIFFSFNFLSLHNTKISTNAWWRYIEKTYMFVDVEKYRITLHAFNLVKSVFSFIYVYTHFLYSLIILLFIYNQRFEKLILTSVLDNIKLCVNFSCFLLYCCRRQGTWVNKITSLQLMQYNIYPIFIHLTDNF